jgi:hypothetical protein
MSSSLIFNSRRNLSLSIVVAIVTPRW